MTNKYNKIWVIGGTSNATEICKRLVNNGYSVIVSVTTNFGRELSESTQVQVVQAMLSVEDMEQLVKSNKVDMIVDASHPFATEVSRNAMLVARNLDLKYIRFERATIHFESTLYVADYEAGVDYLSTKSGNVLLTTGSKFVSKFISLGVDRLFARVLSSSDSVSQCEKAGLKPNNIIAMCGAGSVELNFALMNEFKIQYLVTKESGSEGGLSEKIEAAKNAGVEVIIIQRPTIEYPEKYSDYDILMENFK